MMGMSVVYVAYDPRFNSKGCFLLVFRQKDCFSIELQMIKLNGYLQAFGQKNVFFVGVADIGYIQIEAQIHLLVFVSFELFKLRDGFGVVMVSVRTRGREFKLPSSVT